MLTDRELEKLIQPIITRQENINNYVIQVIAERVKDIENLLPSDVYKLERLLKSGQDVRKINKEIARLTGLNERDIKKLIQTVAEDAYIDAKPYYDYRSLPYIPLEQNTALRVAVEAIAKQTVDTYVNLSKAQAFMIRDLKNPSKLIPTTVSKTYYSVIDEAVQASQSGTTDYHTAMRRTLKQLADSGLRSVEYNTESGRRFTQRLDTAVRRNLLDGVRAINQKVQDITGEQFGADGKEITVHANSAPDHEPVQGHQFTNEEFEKLQNDEPFEDVDGEKFDAIARPIGVLNCRHFTYSIIIGLSKPNFTKAQLQKMKAENQRGYTAPDGTHYTMYECTQKQRAYETKIREQKERQMLFEQSGDAVGAQEARAKVVDLQKKYRAFSRACGLSIKNEKTSVLGYKNQIKI